jgi:hypothetical protein
MVQNLYCDDAFKLLWVRVAEWQGLACLQDVLLAGASPGAELALSFDRSLRAFYPANRTCRHAMESISSTRISSNGSVQNKVYDANTYQPNHHSSTFSNENGSDFQRSTVTESFNKANTSILSHWQQA